MNRIRIGRPRAQSERPWPGYSRRTRETRTSSGQGARAGRVPKRRRVMIAWTGKCLWPAVRMVIRAVLMAHDEQPSTWECVLLTSGAAPLVAAGPLRWVVSLGGYWLAGSHLPAQDPAETACILGRTAGSSTSFSN
jgi:hypothetical protein